MFASTRLAFGHGEGVTNAMQVYEYNPSTQHEGPVEYVGLDCDIGFAMVRMHGLECVQLSAL